MENPIKKPEQPKVNNAPEAPKQPTQNNVSPSAPKQPKVATPKTDPVRQKIMSQGFAPNKNTEYVDRIKSMAVYPRVESKYGKDVLDEGMKSVGFVFNSKKPFPKSFNFDAKTNPNYEYDIHKDNVLGKNVANNAFSYWHKKSFKDLEKNNKGKKISNKQYSDYQKRKENMLKALNDLLSDQELSVLFEDELNDYLKRGIERGKKSSEFQKARAEQLKIANTKNKVDSIISDNPELEENRQFLEKLYATGYIK